MSCRLNWKLIDGCARSLSRKHVKCWHEQQMQESLRNVLQILPEIWMPPCRQLSGTSPWWQDSQISGKKFSSIFESLVWTWIAEYLTARSADVLEPSDRGAELDQLRKELVSAHDGRRVAEAIKTAELEKLRAELNRLKEEHRVTETSQITFRMVAESHLEYHKQILATARFQAATLHSDISNYLHAYNEVVTEVKSFVQDLHDAVPKRVIIAETGLLAYSVFKQTLFDRFVLDFRIFYTGPNVGGGHVH